MAKNARPSALDARERAARRLDLLRQQAFADGLIRRRRAAVQDGGGNVRDVAASQSAIVLTTSAISRSFALPLEVRPVNGRRGFELGEFAFQGPDAGLERGPGDHPVNARWPSGAWVCGLISMRFDHPHIRTGQGDTASE
jgi:hypothetical protein